MTYRFTGKVQGRHARRFSLSVTPCERAGMCLRRLDGIWDNVEVHHQTATVAFDA
ncbi:MAG: hypothetical protein JWN52_280 [Actinomycetia bacterium]|nr:hypothetical protein [Actinomycetes bacterium]